MNGCASPPKCGEGVSRTNGHKPQRRRPGRKRKRRPKPKELVGGPAEGDEAGLPLPSVYTPDPGEVDQFLRSVIGALSPPATMDDTCLPSLAHDLPGDRPIAAHDPSNHSPTQTAVNSFSDSSANPTLDRPPSSPPPDDDDAMPPPSPAVLEDCRKHLVPVLLASAQAKDPPTPLDAQQCVRLLSDDHCQRLFGKAGEMRVQLASLVSSKKAPAHVGDRSSGSSPSLRRDRVDDADAWTRRTRTRLDSITTVASDVSRKDSDATLVDLPVKILPPKAPRAMLLASQPFLNNHQSGAPDKTLFPSPPTPPNAAASAAALLELVHQAIKMFPALAPTSQDPVGTLSGDSGQAPDSAPPSTTDFVSHLPTRLGIWFRQQGRQHAEVVDVDIDVSDDMFYTSTERLPVRLRAHLRLCSLPINATTENDGGSSTQAPASLQDIDGVIERHALHWPKKGKLVVQVNPESERSKTWLPYTLESDPLDVTSCVRPGKNTFRFIQLSDLSEFTFVLAASPPPPEEAWRSWDWASLRRSSLSLSSDDDPMNGLSEFARIPITLRS